MESEVHQTFGDIDFCNSSRFSDRTNVNDTLVGDSSVLTFIENFELAFEPLRDVVRVKDRNLVCSCPPMEDYE